MNLRAMKLPHRRQFLYLAAGAAALPTVSRIARTQPIRHSRYARRRLSAGDSTDILARLIGQWLSERLGEQYVIENWPGAGGNIATEAVVNAPLTAIRCSWSLQRTQSTRHSMTKSTSISFGTSRRSRASCARFTSWRSTHGFQVRRFPSSSPTLRPIRARSTWRRLAAGPATRGWRTVQVDDRRGIVHVPYRGAAPSLTDLIGGQVQVMFDNMTSSLEYMLAGKLRALAVTTATRSEALPDIATVDDFVPGFEAVLNSVSERPRYAGRGYREARP